MVQDVGSAMYNNYIMNFLDNIGRPQEYINCYCMVVENRNIAFLLYSVRRPGSMRSLSFGLPDAWILFLTAAAMRSAEQLAVYVAEGGKPVETMAIKQNQSNTNFW